MRLIIIQLQRQSLLIFGRFSSVKNYSPIHIFPLEDRRMTLASMHPMFQVSISFCHHSSPNLFGKSMFTYSFTCQVEVVVSAESKLHSRNCKIHWNLEVSARVPRLESNYVSTCKIATTVFCDRQFLERPSLWLMETLQSTFLWSAQKTNFLTTKMAFGRC